MNLPNLLTILRIFFVPLLVAALVGEARREMVALAIFLCAAGTDLLDGYLARRWGQVTTVGTLLDPIADKLLVSAALISLVQVGEVPGWMAILIVGREFAVSGLRSIAASQGYVIPAGPAGKTKMAFQTIAISSVLLSMQFPWLKSWAALTLWAVMAATLWSAADYFGKFWTRVDEGVKRRRRMDLLGRTPPESSRAPADGSEAGSEGCLEQDSLRAEAKSGR
jgi:CDP-diacylglycerol--glycerol-3-phosphate 3-phosphatidyltransferase